MKQLLTYKEVAELLRIKLSTVRRYARLGAIKSTIINKRGDRRFTEQQIEEYLSKNNK